MFIPDNHAPSIIAALAAALATSSARVKELEGLAEADKNIDESRARYLSDLMREHGSMREDLERANERIVALEAEISRSAGSE